MESLEGGIVSARMIGSPTPARGVGHHHSDPDEDDEVSGIQDEMELEPAGPARAPAELSWDELPTTVYAERSFSPRRPKLMSRSLAMMVWILGFLSGAVVSAIGLPTFKRAPGLIARGVALVQPTPIEMEAPRSMPIPTPAPTLSSQQEIAPDASELISDPPEAAPLAATTDAPPTVTTKKRNRARGRQPKASSSTSAEPATESEMPAPRAPWVDPFAD
jgi:hypothetical protein